jgi:DNA-binding LacI/PurR family transcriptional regulator
MDNDYDKGKRVTLRDIAKEAGVSHSTVSRALQGSPLVQAKTRERLVDLAEQMGYRPDPMLSALTAYRSKIQLHKQRDALAFVIGPYVQNSWQDIIESAHARAERLGFDLQLYIWDENLPAARQSEILRSRGIRGLIVGPLTKENHLIELPLRLSYFSFVAIGRFISIPKINIVTPNHFGSVRQAIRHLRKKGYRRIGLALLERLNYHVDDRIRTAYLAYSSKIPENERIPPCIPSDESHEDEEISDWIKREKPEAIISYSHYYEDLIAEGFNIPEDFAFASLNLSSRYEHKVAGTNVNDRMVGQVAVNQLNSQLLIGEIGAPEVQQTIIVDTFWEEGHTAPTLKSEGASA